MKSKLVYKMAKHFLKDESGVAATEYGLLLAVVFLLILGGSNSIGGYTTDAFERLANVMTKSGK